MDASGFYSDINATGPSIAHIAGEELAAGGVTLKVDGRKLLIAITGEPPGDLLLARFQEGLARNLLHPNMRVLVDMRRFFGVVDWQAIAQLRKLAPWGEDSGHPSRVAYLMKSFEAAILIKATGALFTRSEHKVFTEQAAAIAWLES